MRLPSDMLHAFFTMDAYTVVTISTEAGITSRQTRVVRNHLMPIWNEKIGFEDVALNNMLTLAIFDHKKLTSDICLGQVHCAFALSNHPFAACNGAAGGSPVETGYGN